MRRNKGFTLVELLVVIAIIGILSSVVFASLGTARAKASDANIKQSLNSLRSAGELFYDNQSPNTYTGVCADTEVGKLITAAKTAAGITAATNDVLATAGSNTTATCHTNGSAYAVEVPLKSNSANGWCVDSAGQSKSTVGHLAASAVICP